NESNGNLNLTGANSNVIVQNNLTNNGSINSYGIIDLYGDWINNSTCTHNNTSYVYLKGANQTIGGNASTTFYNLYLEGTGTKTLGINQTVDGTLDLKDRELATQSYTMNVSNASTSAIQRTTGFVSSTVGGGLARSTNSTSTYLYPVGVSGKYRPAEITPSSTSSATFKVRMANGDATSEGYNRNNKAADVCDVNSSFFHIMQRTSGSINANIKVYYDNSTDGSWDKVGYWSSNLWNNYSGSSTSSGSPLYYGSANNVNLASSTPIALTKNAPVLSVNASLNPICSGQSTVLTASGANTYSWSHSLGTGSSKTVTPTSTTTYTVTGTLANGCSSTASITVTVNPTPAVTASASPSTICSGVSSVLTAGGANTYSWSGGIGSGSSKTVSPTSTTTYTVTGTSAAGCTNTAIVTVTVNPTPTVTATASPSTICSGASSVLTAGGASTYSWSGGLGTGSSKTVSPTSTTTYTVTGTSTEGCTGTKSVTVTVNPTPTVSASASPSTICSGASSVLTAGGANTFSWSGGLGTGSSKTVSPTSTTTYTVTGTSAAGCTGKKSVTVTVNPTPTVTATASPSTICSGASSVLTASGASTYSWSNSLGTGSSKTVSPTSTTTYTVTGTSAEGCTNTATVTVTVNPTPTVTASASPSTICSGSSSTLTAGGANTYSWSGGLGTGSSKTVSPTSTTTYTVTGTSAEGCTNTATVTVTVNPLPTAYDVTGGGSYCSGGTGVPVGLLGSESGVNYQLQLNGSDVGTSVSGTGSAISFGNQTVAGTYTVVATNATTSCVNNMTGSVTVTIDPLPTIAATASPSSICLGNSSVLTASSNITGTTYSWSGTLGVGSTKTVTPTSTTSYTVTGTSTAGCAGTATVSVTVNALPDISIDASESTICNGQTSVLTASGADFYSWSHNLGTGLSKTVSPTSTTTYTVTGSYANGCSSTATIQITVNPIPVIIINASNNSICFGDSSILTVIGDATQYSWSHNLGTSESVIIKPISITTYSVIGTNEYGCTNSANITITVLPNADATIKPVTPLCDNLSTITLNATDSGGVWSGNGIINQVLGTFSPSLAGAGTHIITYMIMGQCGDTATTEVIVYESPTAIAYATDETCIDANDGIAWVITTGGTAPYTYLWSNNYILDTITNLAPGEYYVTVRDFHNCFDTDTVIIKEGTEDCYITHVYVPNIFSPNDKGNPENEYLRVYGKGIKTIDFTIFDRWGNEVFHTTSMEGKWDGTYKGEPALVGDYTYILKVKYFNKPDEILRGHVYLVR
ncbi:MAG: gliding motility-associated C-terminal domain-containing protein, partial [Bacteroidales bacterium]